MIKMYIRIGFIMLAFDTFCINLGSAQCDNPSQWPAGTVNITCGTNTITNNIYAGEYSVTKGYQDQSTLTFSSSIPTDYITVRKATDNTLIASGLSPMSMLYFASDDSLEVHINTNAACGTQASPRVSSVFMVCGCNNVTQYPLGITSLSSGLNTISTAQWAGDYNLTTGYIEGSLCTYTSSVSSDYITLRNAANNLIIATGLTPLTITYTSSMGPNIEMHINTDASCGTQNTNRTTTVNMINIYSGGNDDGYVQTCYAQADNPILAIYKGSKDDGFVQTCYAQADNAILAIYKGGNDDGFVQTCYTQADNAILAIYKGGIDDGFVQTCYAQADNPLLATIYKGGNDDGFVQTYYAQADNTLLATIYKGGIDDGFVQTYFAQADNPLLATIYKGGIDDGFVQTCYAQDDNPLLVTIYRGGFEDGFTNSCYAQTDGAMIAIYYGGNDDGFSTSCFAQGVGPIYAIYNGGIDDGFTSSCFAQGDGVIYAIYKGGNDDGFTLACYEQCGIIGNTIKWIGNISINWHTAANWECGFLPVLTSDVIVPSGAVFMPTVSANDEIRSLLMQPGSTLIILPPAVLRLKVN